MKSKVTKLEQWGAADDHGNFPHNIAFEDGTEGSYRGNPTKGLSFKIGEEGEYEVEKKVSGKGKEYNKITPPKKEFVKGGGYTPKPSNEVALELARKMYNSSHQTEDKWDIDRMLKTSIYLKKKIDGGVKKAAVECSTTIECANAMNGISINSKELDKNITEINDWLNKNS